MKENIIVEYDIYLRDTVTGDTRTYRENCNFDETIEDSDSGMVYRWERGNYSCDCNRCLFLWHWSKKPEHDLDCNCANTPRIHVDKIVNTTTGKELEGDWNANL